MELDHESVYRLEPDTDGKWTIHRATFDTTRPNGLLFSLDHRTLYVAQSGRRPDEKRQLRAYPVQDDGSLGEGEVLGHSYVNRFRYFLKGTMPFARDDRYFAFYNELMVGFGENVQRNIFDQNRAYAAIGFRTGPATSFEIGYLLQTVQRPTENMVLFNHTFQLGFFSSRPIG